MAVAVTDPFAKLPSELRRQVLLLTDCKSSILRMIQASPIMLREYLAQKKHIIRQVMASEFDEQMIQDAMAIILLPIPRSTHWNKLSKRQSRSIREHILAWSESQLPDPIKEGNDDRLGQLNKLHSQLLVLVEDYITKATASFPPREYLCLPHVQQPLTEGHVMFRGVKVTPRFSSANLTSLERKRFIKAFLLYELFCKISNAPHASGLVRQHREVSYFEYEALGCVHNYIRSLYGAMFAQCNDGWLPSTSTEASLGSGLLFPDTYYFDAKSYSPNFDVCSLGIVPRHDLGDCFSTTGLDYLTIFLGYGLAIQDEREALMAQFEYVWGFERPFRSYKWDISFALLLTTKPTYEESSMYKQLFLNRDNTLRHQIFQQRAWVFFDDNRFYPQESPERPNFPSESFLMEEPTKEYSKRAWSYNPKEERGLRRSQRWHDGRNRASGSNVNTPKGRGFYYIRRDNEI
ncbi:Ff.00g067600.m01.CDS01 [Fusarium sp. VM40]|nr:Ff.00g067600.m01.CDS01 [Fusarium sp. VM40]